MRNAELCDAYLKRVSRRREKDEDSLGILLPFLMMDTVQLIYSHTIAPLNLKHEAKALSRKWKENYNLLNREFFSAFTPDQRDAVIDKMDDFEEYIGNAQTIAEVSVMTAVQNVADLDGQQYLSQLWIAYMMTQGALDVWQQLYVYTSAGSKEEPHIAAIRHAIMELSRLAPGAKGDIDRKRYDEACKCGQALYRKILDWIKMDEARDKERS